MPKALTDKDRLLNFAFRASTEELVEAMGILKAAHAAKAGGAGTPRRAASRRAATNRRGASADNKASDPTDDTTVN